MNRSHLATHRKASVNRNANARRRDRDGFTLTEMLVVITVIGLLAGIIVPVVMNTLRTAKEAAIILEMKQIEMALHQFKSDHGFYPPSFVSGTDAAGNSVGVDSAAEMLRYINRIAPQHAERLGSGVTGGGSLPGGERTRLEHWWIEVGSNLNQETSLLFWLSGVCKNKQFPLTGGVTTFTAGTPPLAAHGYDPGDTIQREDYFEFKANQLNISGAYATYNQAYGKSNTDLTYKYRDAATYDVGGMSNTTQGDAYRLGPQDGSETPLPDFSDGDPPPYQFANPDTFQLITAGLDGLLGAAGNVNGGDAGVVQRTDDSGSAVNFNGWEGADNLVNFAEGRLDKFLNTVDQ